MAEQSFRSLCPWYYQLRIIAFAHSSKRNYFVLRTSSPSLPDVCSCMRCNTLWIKFQDVGRSHNKQVPPITITLSSRIFLESVIINQQGFFDQGSWNSTILRSRGLVSDKDLKNTAEKSRLKNRHSASAESPIMPHLF